MIPACRQCVQVLDKAPAFASRDGSSPDDCKRIVSGWLSSPAPGKHIRFDGSFLHGGPDMGFEPQAADVVPPRGGRSSKRKMRVSLLVNVWLDGAPGFAAPLPPAVAAKLSPCLSRAPFRIHKNEVSPVVTLPGPSKEGGDRGKRSKRGGGRRCGGDANRKTARQEFTWPVALASGTACSLCVRLPVAVIAQRLSPGCTLEFGFGFGEAELV